MSIPVFPRRGGQPSLTCLEDPRPDEVHVLLLGLDGLAAALAVGLLRCGVLGFNVSDPRPVTTADLVAGAYRPADVGRPREAALRRRLRELDARCAPISAPELFPGALLPGTVVVRTAGPPHAEPGTLPDLDPRHPLVSLHREDGVLLRWPTVPWAHRPCPDCVRATLEGREPEPAPHGPARVLAGWAGPAHEAAVAAGLAVEVLAVALHTLWSGHEDLQDGGGEDCGTDPARIFTPPWPDEVQRLRPDRSRCLCGLGQE